MGKAKLLEVQWRVGGYPSIDTTVEVKQRFRGVAEYYKYTTDRYALGNLKHVMEVSLTNTLADKLKTSVSKIYRKYVNKRTVDGYTYKVLVVEAPTKNRTRYFYWGGIPLKVVKRDREPMDDNMGGRNVAPSSRTDWIQRLQANECEICSMQGSCEVHHIHKLVDLKNRWRGRKEKPDWVIRMITLQRKTLVGCEKCHDAIHLGKPLLTWNM